MLHDVDRKIDSLEKDFDRKVDSLGNDFEKQDDSEKADCGELNLQRGEYMKQTGQRRPSMTVRFFPTARHIHTDGYRCKLFVGRRRRGAAVQWKLMASECR